MCERQLARVVAVESRPEAWINRKALEEMDVELKNERVPQSHESEWQDRADGANYMATSEHKFARGQCMYPKVPHFLDMQACMCMLAGRCISREPRLAAYPTQL